MGRARPCRSGSVAQAAADSRGVTPEPLDKLEEPAFRLLLFSYAELADSCKEPERQMKGSDGPEQTRMRRQASAGTGLRGR